MSRTAEQINWRDADKEREERGLTAVEKDFDLDSDNDGDDILPITPPDVVAKLGFDPLDEI